MEQMPEEFYEDREWAFDNYSKFIQQYPNKWIAVVDKKVVAANEDLQKVETEAKKKTHKKHVPVLFIEKSGMNVYSIIL